LKHYKHSSTDLGSLQHDLIVFHLSTHIQPACTNYVT